MPVLWPLPSHLQTYLHSTPVTQEKEHPYLYKGNQEGQPDQATCPKQYMNSGLRQELSLYFLSPSPKPQDHPSSLLWATSPILCPMPYPGRDDWTAFQTSEQLQSRLLQGNLAGNHSLPEIYVTGKQRFPTLPWDSQHLLTEPCSWVFLFFYLYSFCSFIYKLYELLL